MEVVGPQWRVANAAEVTLDFSGATPGQFLPQTFFQSQGLVFSGDYGVTSLLQGHPALTSSDLIAGSFTMGINRLSLDIAPAVQGAANYTLTAFDDSSNTIGSASVEIIQDSGNPNTGPSGYVTLDLGNLSNPAYAFELQSAFISSSFPEITNIPYGIRSITFNQVPEPTSAAMVIAAMFGCCVTLGAQRRSRPQ